MSIVKDQLIQQAALVLSEQKYTHPREYEMMLSSLLMDYDLVPKTTAIVKVDSTGEGLIKRFIVCKKIEGLSQNTLRYYSSRLKKFYEYCKFVPIELQNVTADVIRGYIADGLINHNWSYTNADNDRRILSSFFSWAADEDIIRKNPVAKVKALKQRKTIRKPFTNTEIEKMRDWLVHNGDIRDRAIFEFLLSTGCRISECCGIKISDINIAEKEAIVLGKGNKERIVFLNDTSIYYLKRYLEVLPAEKHAGDYLFVSKEKSQKTGLHYKFGKSGCEIMIREMGRALGIEAFPHKFRHTAATIALSRGMAIEQVRQMLGHEQIATTLIYAHSDITTVKQAHQKLM